MRIKIITQCYFQKKYLINTRARFFYVIPYHILSLLNTTVTVCLCIMLSCNHRYCVVCACACMMLSYAYRYCCCVPVHDDVMHPSLCVCIYVLLLAVYVHDLSLCVHVRDLSLSLCLHIWRTFLSVRTHLPVRYIYPCVICLPARTHLPVRIRLVGRREGRTPTS